MVFVERIRIERRLKCVRRHAVAFVTDRAVNFIQLTGIGLVFLGSWFITSHRKAKLANILSESPWPCMMTFFIRRSRRFE